MPRPPSRYWSFSSRSPAASQRVTGSQVHFGGWPAVNGTDALA